MADAKDNKVVSTSEGEQHQAASSVQEPAQDKSETRKGDDGNNDDDDENETCGFCIFMKGGGCRQAFNTWSKCVDKERQENENFAERCHEATMALRQCMLANREYYAPLLEEEEAAMQEMQRAEEVQKAAEASGVVEALEEEKGGSGA